MKTKKAPRTHLLIPPPHEITTLRVLQSERAARACELIEASRGMIPRNQAWMILRRLRRRGAIKVANRVDGGRGGPTHPVYKLTDHGRRVLRAMDVLEGRK